VALPLEVQAMLLTFIETDVYRRVGGNGGNILKDSSMQNIFRMWLVVVSILFFHFFVDTLGAEDSLKMAYNADAAPTQV